MQPVLVVLVYGAALGFALALLYAFQLRWFWHALSVAAALAIGFTPIPPEWRIPDLAVGFAFIFLFVWGAAAPLFRTHHAHRHAVRHA
jgi:ABC-type lipoprotein release transport system permease subunit